MYSQYSIWPATQKFWVSKYKLSCSSAKIKSSFKQNKAPNFKKWIVGMGEVFW